MNVNKYLTLATQIAIKNRSSKHYHLAAVAIRKDGSITSASNIKTQQPNVMAHAETRVLKKSGNNATLFIARVMADGSWGMANPCENCRKEIKKKNVKSVFYTIKDSEYGVWNL